MLIKISYRFDRKSGLTDILDFCWLYTRTILKNRNLNDNISQLMKYNTRIFFKKNGSRYSISKCNLSLNGLVITGFYDEKKKNE